MREGEGGEEGGEERGEERENTLRSLFLAGT